MQKQYSVTVKTDETAQTVLIEAGSSLLEAAVGIPGTGIETPCGGNGLCGKCRMRVISGSANPPTSEELRMLHEHELLQGIRLACCCIPEGDMSISSVETSAAGSIVTEFSPRDAALNLRFSIIDTPLKQRSLEDQRALSDDIDSSLLSLGSLRTLALQSGEPSVKVLADRSRGIQVMKDGDRPYGFAADIGTTTVVVYLADLCTGEIIDHRAQMNLQRRFGSDVISRIQYSCSKPAGTEEVSRTIVDQLDGMMQDLILSHNLHPEDLIETVLVGNTTMLHLLAGVYPESIALSPFIPVFTHPISCSMQELGFSRTVNGRALLPGSVSAYIGADITAGLYASGITSLDHPALFIDVGTNGECALWDTKTLYCCSTAAGPAFEGASILHGIGGIAGAVCGITAVTKDNQVQVTARTIDEAPPRGICGSGIIDAAAVLLDLGLADETGRMVSLEEDPWNMLKETPHGTAFSICSTPEREIYLTQGDVREIQLAKAAVSAGIKTLFSETGISGEQIGTVILAGGFGQHLHIPSVQRIGLLTGDLQCEIRPGGNTAGKGAAEVLLHPDALDALEDIRSSARYIELSSSPVFQMHFIEEMIFPEQENSNG